MDWGIVSDVAIPVAAILVPSLIAIWLARSERDAARAERAAEDSRRQHEREEVDVRREDDRAAAGVEHSIDAMTDLVEAAYTDDFRLAASIRIRAARRLVKTQSHFGEANQPVVNWISKELGITAAGLEDRDHANLPVNLEQIVWRSANFGDVLTNWRTGSVNVDWFREAEHSPLAETERPDLTELP